MKRIVGVLAAMLMALSIAVFAMQVISWIIGQPISLFGGEPDLEMGATYILLFITPAVAKWAGVLIDDPAFE